LHSRRQYVNDGTRSSDFSEPNRARQQHAAWSAAANARLCSSASRRIDDLDVEIDADELMPRLTRRHHLRLDRTSGRSVNLPLDRAFASVAKLAEVGLR
jgi:hypothetical protein